MNADMDERSSAGAIVRRIRRIAALMVVTSLVLPVTVWAKRTPAPVIEPIVHAGVRYTVPNDRGTVGYVVALDVATGKQLWKKTVFRKCICPCLEHDVQWVFIKEMRLDGERLLLVTETDSVYSLDLKTRKVKKLKTKAPGRQQPQASAAGAKAPTEVTAHLLSCQRKARRNGG